MRIGNLDRAGNNRSIMTFPMRCALAIRQDCRTSNSASIGIQFGLAG
jgi:hypothetical protein